MARYFKSKDFSIKSQRCGSRLKGGPQWQYKIIYTNPQTGRQVELEKRFYTKQAARQYISRCVQVAEKMKNREDAPKDGQAGNDRQGR